MSDSDCICMTTGDSDTGDQMNSTNRGKSSKNVNKGMGRIIVDNFQRGIKTITSELKHVKEGH